MSPAKRPRSVLLALASLSFLATIHGQVNAPTIPGPELRTRPADEKRDASLLINAMVLDGKGKPVSHLQQGDFSLFDNRRKLPQSAWQLVEKGTPVSQSPQVILVVDGVNSSLPELSRTEAAIRIYLQKGQDPLSQRTTILFVGDAPPSGSLPQQTSDKAATMVLDHSRLFVHRTPTSSDRKVLMQALDDYKPGLPATNDAQGASVQSDHVRLSLQALSYIASAYKSIKGPKLVLWLGPGWPFLAQSAAKSSQQLFDSIIYFTNLLQDAQITLYSIAPEGVTAGDTAARTESFELAQRASSNRSIGGSPPPGVPVDLSNTYYADFLKGVRTARQSNPNDLDLQVLAFHTGGLILGKNNDLVAEIERCVADANAMYIFSYTPEKSGGPDSYHELSIRTSTNAQPVRASTGFYTR